jgi:hypothetical protein
MDWTLKFYFFTEVKGVMPQAIPLIMIFKLCLTGAVMAIEYITGFVLSTCIFH